MAGIYGRGETARQKFRRSSDKVLFADGLYLRQRKEGCVCERYT